MKNLIRFLVVTVTLALVVTAFSQTTQQQPQEQLSDELFIMAAAQGDLYEIQSSQVAQERAESDEVRSFAERMLEDHSMTTEELESIAEQLGVLLPETTTAAHLLKLHYLLQLEGEDFDRAYMEQQVLVHRSAVSLFEIAIETAEHEEVRAFAEAHLPDIREHLQMAEELLAGLGENDNQND